MSTIAISYDGLKDASREANSVAKKLENYADSLSKKVYKKLNNYNSGGAADIRSARLAVKAKMDELNDKAERYEEYASKLTDLVTECKETDKAVRSRVSSLTASFKDRNGIKNRPVQNALNYFSTKVNNGTAAGRWIDRSNDIAQTGENYLKDCIKEWWDYKGGKEAVFGIGKAVLTVAIGVVSAVLAVVTGGALIVVIAGVVAGAIMAINGVIDIINEGRAIAAQKEDPARAKRLSGMNTFQDTVRMDETKDEHVGIWHDIADGVDVVNTVCTIITLIPSFAKALKGLKNLPANCYKWATGSKAQASSIKLKDIFKKDTFTKGWGKLKTGAVDLWSDVKFAVRNKDFTKIQPRWERITSGFKDKFFKFAEEIDPNTNTSTGKLLSFKKYNDKQWEDALKSIKTMISTTQKTWSGGETGGLGGAVLAGVKAFIKEGGKGIVLFETETQGVAEPEKVKVSNFTDVAKLVTDPKKAFDNVASFAKGMFSIFGDRDVPQIQIQVPEININIPEIKIESIQIDMPQAGINNPMSFSGKNQVKDKLSYTGGWNGVASKLSVKSNVSVAIPEFCVPKITMPVLRTA